MKKLKEYFKTASDFQQGAIIGSIVLIIYINGTMLVNIGEQRDAYIVDVEMLLFAVCFTVGLWALGFVSGYRSNNY